MESNLFDLNGHSPLVDYFLYKNAFNKSSIYENVLTMSSVSSLPPLNTPTYHDVIVDSLKLTRKLKDDYNAFVNFSLWTNF